MKINKFYILQIVLFLFFLAKLNAQDALTANITNPTYNKDCKNGKIDLMINAGFAPYEVIWKRTTINGTYTVQSNDGIQGNNDGEDLQAVFSGTYQVEVIDALCGKARKSFKIKCVCNNDCSVVGQVTHPTCELESAIEIDVNCTELGHFPFSYKWSDGSSLKDRSNLDPGIYCLTVSDKNACSFENCFTIETGNILQVAIANKKNVQSCAPNNGICNGSIDIAIVTGNGGYQYKWSNGANTQDLSNLCAGNYILTVTDNLNCKKILNINICCCSVFGGTGIEDCYGNVSNPTPLNLQADVQGFPNPYILTQISGGTGEYTCTWEGPNGYTAYSCFGIGDLTEIGTYCIKIDDGCQELMRCFEIVDCDQSNIAVTANILKTCDELTVGRISLTITGGTPPYEISWNNSQYVGATIQGLDQGQYCAYVRDANGCLAGPFCFTVGSQPGEITTSTIPCARTILCNGQAYTDYFEYELSLDCNTRYSYCPATGETIIEDLGWANVYVSFCTMYGVCQDGETKFIAFGETLQGPYNVFDEACNEGEACVNYKCYFPTLNRIVQDDSYPVYCATITDYLQKGTCGNFCSAKVYCGNTYMKTICTSLPCIQAFNDTDKYSVATQSTNEPLTSNNIITSDQLTKWVNTQQLKQIDKQTRPKLDQNYTISVYPNPTSGSLNVEMESTKKELVSFVLVNVLGKEVDRYTVEITKGMNKFTIDITSYNQGVYFLQTTVGKSTKTLKIIKE